MVAMRAPVTRGRTRGPPAVWASADRCRILADDPVLKQSVMPAGTELDGDLAWSHARFLGYDAPQAALYASLTGYPQAQIGNAPGFPIRPLSSHLPTSRSGGRRVGSGRCGGGISARPL
jgi:hypothetical protein